MEKLKNNKKKMITRTTVIIRRVKGDYKKFFTNIKKGVKTNTVRAKKLSLMKNYSIPLDTNSWSMKKKNQIGLNLNSKIFYIHHYHNRLKNIIEDFNNIKSVLIQYINNEIYLNITYNQEPIKIKTNKNIKSALYFKKFNIC